MSAPKYDTCQWNVQNPHASAPLHIPLVVLCNTPDAEIEANIRANTATDHPWLSAKDAHGGIAVMVGGGASLADHLDDIRALVSLGATVFAMNAASQYLRAQGIEVDWQVTCDSKAETARLVDPEAKGHLFSSNVNPETLAAAPAPLLWHSAVHSNEDWFPAHKRKRGGYVILGGEASTGLGALCVAYAIGFRRLEIFGYDSCHQDGQSHAYRQSMNDPIPVMYFEWAGRMFKTSITMRTQAERFPITAQALQNEGVTLNVHGDGLLQHIWTAPASNLSERNKYSLMWQSDAYRRYSPGEVIAPEFIKMVDPGSGTIIDFGCGTGRGGLALAKAGFDVVLVDFVSSSRDAEAMGLPFLEWDLTQPCPLRAPYGYCCDVMENIPTDDVGAVIDNIMTCVPEAFFQISTVPDAFGATIGEALHLSVFPHDWWRSMFEQHGCTIGAELNGPAASIFVVSKTPN